MGENDQRVITTRGREETSEAVEFVLAADEAGYYEVPRRTPLLELAELEGISDIEASEKLRRGMREIIEDWQTK